MRSIHVGDLELAKRALHVLWVPYRNQFFQVFDRTSLSESTKSELTAHNQVDTCHSLLFSHLYGWYLQMRLKFLIVIV